MTNFRGSLVALVTPFKNGELDLAKTKDLVDFHLQNGTHGLVPVGTTGESPTLTKEEKGQFIKTVIKAAKGRIPVIAGTGSNDTRATIEATKAAKELGADAVLLVTPYYNRPSQEGLYRHYEAVAKAAAIPQILYNVPGRTSCNMLPETVARLSKLKNIVSIKEASGSLEQVTQIRNLCDIEIVSGDDAMTFPIMALGGVGIVSVAANIVPRVVSDLCVAVQKGNFRRGEEIHTRHAALFKNLFIETNPVPVKTAMKMMGLGNGEVRLPLCEMTPENTAKLEKTLQSYELI